MKCRLQGGLGVALAVSLAFGLHGYHFGVADQKLYLPAAFHAADPALYPHDAAFFLNEARFTLYDDAVALTLRAGVPVDVAMFAGQILSLALLVAGTRRLLAVAAVPPAAAWAGVVLLVVTLPAPVAGTRIGILEPYLLPRGLAVGLALWAFVLAAQGRVVAFLVLAGSAALHPLTALWSVGHVLAQLPENRWRRLLPAAGATLAVVATLGCTGGLTPEVDEQTFWRTALAPESFRVRYPPYWPWYEWAGVMLPIVVLALIARHSPNRAMARTGRQLAWSALAGVVVALAITVAPSRELPLQPMRQLHLVYVVAVAFLGVWVEQRLLQGRVVRRLGAFAVAVAMVVATQQRYPSSPFVEWPGRLPDNSYVRAFDWIRTHTAIDARIAVDPFYLRRRGPDWHAARIFTRRSMLSDAVHDLAPAAMAPPLDERWRSEQRALAGWRTFGPVEFSRLARDYEVSWVVVAAEQAPGLDCPFVEPAVRVCRVP
jgi:hypothetical protein